MSINNLPALAGEQQAADAADLTQFAFDGAPVRVIIRGGEPWFVATDVCKIIGVQNVTQAVGVLDGDERSMLKIGPQGEANCVSEGGLYTIILRSRAAVTAGSTPHRFRRWVTSEVIPSIRKTGSYSVAPQPDPMTLLNDPAALRTLLGGYAERVMALEEENKVLGKAKDELDRIAAADGSHCITDSAKILKVRPKDLFAYLSQNGWIYRRAGTDHWCGYQSKVLSGDLHHRVTTVLRPDGSEKTTEQVRVTPQGLVKLAKLVPRAALEVVPRRDH